ncbi:DUF5681 domain-containing protein [Methylobacterium sp. A49B]
MKNVDDEHPDGFLGAEASSEITEDVERVGYKRPPRRTRFRKGQSGNPEGRPKGSLNRSTLRALLATQWLEETIKIVEGGRERHVSRFAALLKKQAELALKGDPKVIRDVIDQLVRMAVDESVSVTNEETSVEDETILRTHCPDVLDAKSVPANRCDDDGKSGRE